MNIFYVFTTADDDLDSWGIGVDDVNNKTRDDAVIKAEEWANDRYGDSAPIEVEMNIFKVGQDEDGEDIALDKEVITIRVESDNWHAEERSAYLSNLI